MNSKQKSLFQYYQLKPQQKRYGRTSHGGLTQGGRKLERPLDARKWLHLVLKSDKARGKYSFLNLTHRQKVESLIESKAQKFGVKIAEMVNMGNHLHLRLRISNRHNFQNFLRSITAGVARLVTGARRGQAFGRFWQGLAFTRVLKTAMEVLRLNGYLEANRIEKAQGHASRAIYLKNFNFWIQSLARYGPQKA